MTAGGIARPAALAAFRGAFFAAAFLALALAAPVSAKAFDFGLLMNQRGWLGGGGGRAEGIGAQAPAGGSGDLGAEYEAALVPRLSLLLGDYGSLFLSGSLRAIYRNSAARGGIRAGEGGGGWAFVPELLRSELSWSFAAGELRAGRMAYADPMRLVAAGLFDGASFSRHTEIGTFGAGIWYTGLLYKNRALIAMTDEDSAALQTELDWGSFADTYFASRRLVAALSWEHPSLFEALGIGAALVGQADLNNRGSALHSQYAIAKATMPFRQFIFELGGAAMLAQEAGNGGANNGGTDFRVALAGDIGAHWMPPSPFHSMLSFTGRFTSGRSESGPMSALAPISSLPHGNVLRAQISGLSMLGLSYAARLRRDFSATLAAAHFVRSDRGTYSAYPLNGAPSANYFLGTEIFGRAVWSPVSDISLNLGAGAFLPSLGDVAPDADPRWRVELIAILALR